MWFKGFEMEEERIDVCAVSLWVELAQGLIRDQQRIPPQLHSLHTATGFSPHYSGADRWASLCISAMHFLKSEKPIHLGRRREQRKTSKLIFFTPWQCSSVIHKLPKHFVSPLIVSVLHPVTCLNYSRSWTDRSFPIPLCVESTMLISSQ